MNANKTTWKLLLLSVLVHGILLALVCNVVVTVQQKRGEMCFHAPPDYLDLTSEDIPEPKEEQPGLTFEPSGVESAGGGGNNGVDLITDTSALNEIITAASKSSPPIFRNLKSTVPPKVNVDALFISKGMSGGNGGGNGSGDGAGNGAGTENGNAGVLYGGKVVKARKLAVVMDLSPSMTTRLDGKVSVILAKFPDAFLIGVFGCSLHFYKGPPPTYRLLFGTSAIQDPAYLFPAVALTDAATIKTRYSEEALSRLLFCRPRIPPVWIPYNNAYFALENAAVSGADAIYWIADFLDAPDLKVVAELRQKLLFGEIPLYVYTLEKKPEWLIALVHDTGGEFLQP